MSGNVLDGVVLPWGEVIRDFLYSEANAGANAAYDIPSTMNAMGLDLFIHNLGAAALTVSINGGAAITVVAGGVYTLSSTKFWMVQVVSAVQFDIQISGVRVSTLKEKGFM